MAGIPSIYSDIHIYFLLQIDLDEWINYYNRERTHSGKYCFGKTPIQTWYDSKHLADEKMLDLQHEKVVYLLVSGEAETSSGGDQLVRNSLIDWNSQGLQKSPYIRIISRVVYLKKLKGDGLTLRSNSSYYTL